MTPATLRGRLALVFVVTGVLTALIVLLVVRSLVGLATAKSDRVEVYGPSLLSSETLGRSLSDQETGLRGYASSGVDGFLDPYEQGQQAEADALRDLREQLAGHEDLLRLVDDVEAAADRWRAEIAEPAIARTRANGPTEATVAQLEAGKVRFDEVRAAIDDLQAPVLDRRNSSQRELDDSLQRLWFTLAGALLLLVLLAVGTWRGLRRWVTRPLEAFGAEVDRVEGGDLSHQVVLSDAPQEIAVLAGQVDRMRLRILQEFALAEAANREAQEARAQLEEQAEDLRRSNTELEQFAYVASHDLQEPLRKVASFCQLIERRYKGQLDERGEQYIEFAVDGAKRMQRLINDLLAFSRVGRLTGEFADVDLEQVLAQALRQLDESITEAGARVTHDALPVVHGDASLLVQLFQNLVGNAVKFRGEDPPTVHISVSRGDEDGDTWSFACADNGIGVEPQYADKIFVIFQRLHGRDAYGGTGIGLAMCKKIVEHHGGRMWLDTAAEHGATLRWTLPAVPAAPSTPVTNPAQVAGSAGIHEPGREEQDA